MSDTDDGTAAGSTTGDHGVAEDCDHLEDLDDESVLPATLAFFGKRHTLAILHEFVYHEDEGPFRFSDLETRLDVASTTLTERLGELADQGYLHRESYDEIPPRVEYEATEKAHDLAPIIEDLYEWAAEYEDELDPLEEAK